MSQVFGLKTSVLRSPWPSGITGYNMMGLGLGLVKLIDAETLPGFRLGFHQEDISCGTQLVLPQLTNLSANMCQHTIRIPTDPYRSLRSKKSTHGSCSRLSSVSVLAILPVAFSPSSLQFALSLRESQEAHKDVHDARTQNVACAGQRKNGTNKLFPTSQ